MSSHQLASPEISFSPEHRSNEDFYKMVKKVTIILSVITVIELCLGLTIYRIGHGNHTSVLMIKGLVTILSLAKAFYITSYFMHLGDEIKNFIMTIVVPLMLFIWFIGAFLYEGGSWRQMRNTNAGSTKYIEEPAHKPAATPGTEH